MQSLSSIFATSVASYAEGQPRTQQLLGEATVHGYTVAFWIAGGIFIFGAVLVGTLMRSIKVEAEPEPSGEPVAA